MMKQGELQRLYNIEDLPTIAASAGDRRLVQRLKGYSMEDARGENSSLVRDTINSWGEERFYRHIDEKLSGPDRTNCLPIVGSTVDVANLTILLRSKILNAPGVKDHLIGSRWKLSQPFMDQVLASTDVSQALDAIASHDYYRQLFAGGRQRYEETKSLAFIEVALRKHHQRLSTRLFLGFPYSVGIDLAFLTIKENEARNLAAVLTGVEAGLPGDDIRSLLVMRD